MWNCFWAAAAALLLVALPARAQTAKAESATEAAAAASAAMERAKRQAAGPMRVILEASRPRRKAADADLPLPPPTPAPADSSVRAVANRSAGVVAAAPEPVTRSIAAVAAPVAPPLAAAAAAAAAAPVVATPSGVVTQMTLTSESLQGKAADRVPGLEGSGAGSATSMPGAAALPSLPALPTTPIGPARVRLVSRVDPELPQRQLDDLGRNAVVMVDLTIRADGSVGKIAMVPPVPRGIQRAVLAALEQWRFEPLPSERVHRVQLIFNPEQ